MLSKMFWTEKLKRFLSDILKNTMMGRGKNGLEDWRIVVVAMWKEKENQEILLIIV